MHLWGSYKTIRKFLEDEMSAGYRDKIVKIEKRQQKFELPGRGDGRKAEEEL